MKCKDEFEESMKKDGKKSVIKKKVDMGRYGVYVGETGRSLNERAGEHFGDAKSMKEDSHMVKHWVGQHPDEETIPEFPGSS